MSGKIVIETLFICECKIKIGGIEKRLNPFKKRMEVEVPCGKHFVNVAIEYDEFHESSRVWSSDIWAWERDREIFVGEKDVVIKIKRKWHLLKPVTAEAVAE